jgi:hypothetical protein
MLQAERLNLDARFREHDAVGCAPEASPVANAAVGESDFVTDSQAFEIMASLPELQPAPDDGGGPCQEDDGAEGPSRCAALGGAPQDEESCESSAPPGRFLCDRFFGSNP